jgi:hypothetical protein
MLRDTAILRNDNYHESTDTPATLDFGRKAKVVTGAREIIREFARG